MALERTRLAFAASLAIFAGATSSACGDDDEPTDARDTSAPDSETSAPDGETSQPDDTSAPDDSAQPDTTPDTVAQTPCDRAGGAAAVAGVIYNKANAVDPNTLVGRFAADCKINSFFTSLPADRLNHTGECLAIQVQELFGCEGVTYAGSEDSLGVLCRDMKTTHAGLEISKGDFDALIADVVAFVTPLVQAGVLTEAELTATAGILLGLEDDIVEQPEVTTATKPACTACDRIGGNAAVSGAVYNPANAVDPGTLVGRFAADCKINSFFTSLPADRLDHTGQCLAIQVQELLGCEGVTYAGSTDSEGVACRDMKTTHEGLEISKGDFDALIADVVAFVQPLVDAGLITNDEFTAAAGVLLGLEDDIVEQPEVVNLTKPYCDPCDRIGGNAAVSGAVYNKANAVDPGTLVGVIAGDCKISAFFTTLSSPALNHVGECLAIQVQELLGCDGVTYAGSVDSMGSPCRDMKTTHEGLDISKGDFDALIADVVTFVQPLVDTGLITNAEFGAAANILLSLEADIVEQPEVTDTTMDICIEPEP